MSGQTAIRIEQVGKSFGAGPLVLDDVNLAVHEAAHHVLELARSAGETVNVPHDNGANPTTLVGRTFSSAPSMLFMRAWKISM